MSNPEDDAVSEMVRNFCEITSAQEGTAAHYLEMTGYDLGHAIELYFSHGETGGAPVRTQVDPQAHRQTSRLSHDDGERGGYPQSFFEQFAGTRFPANIVPPMPDVEVFRPPPRPQVEELSDDDDGVDHQNKMHQLFRPPSYGFRGKFAECCEHAAASSHYVILNILQRDDFRSGCMNRDLWRHTMVSDIIPDSFELFQVMEDTDDGQLLMATYRVRKDQLPCIMFMNPLTKSVITHVNTGRLLQANGVYNVTTFLDDVTTFVEVDHGAFRRVATEELDEQEDVLVARSDRVADSDLDDAILQQALAESREEARLATALAAALRESAPEEPVWKQAKTETPPAPKVADAAPITVPAPDMSAFLVDASATAAAYHLRVRLPSGTLEVHVSATTPIVLLAHHVAYCLHTSNPATYPLPPSIELRAGYPLRPLPVDVTLSECSQLRPNDNITVHVI